jgi:Niemann-Pick C1 protein
MNEYLDDLVQMPYISEPPKFFWLRDFLYFVELISDIDERAAGLAFNDQLTTFLDTPPFDVLYGKDIVRDSNGDVTASRCQVIMDQGSNYDIQVQMATVREQYKVTSSQPINDGKSDWVFFMFSKHFYPWELHNLMARELFLTLILGLVSVFVISVLFIPHPFGALVLPTIVGAVYFELMAFLYVVRVYINVISAIGLLMSLGLIVDYNMHVALTYHENKGALSRDEKVKKVLTTMGASIWVGGVTTMTSALPLSLTASLVFKTFFFTFLAIPVLGVAHGLILLPVILSLWGPHTGRTSSQPCSTPAKLGVSSTSESLPGSQESSPEEVQAGSCYNEDKSFEAREDCAHLDAHTIPKTSSSGDVDV